jgi:hypothetical protein
MNISRHEPRDLPKSGTAATMNRLCRDRGGTSGDVARTLSL